MNQSLKKISFVILLAVITLSSCKKDRDDLADTDTSLAQKYSTAEQSNNDLDGLANEIVYSNTTTLKTEETFSTKTAASSRTNSSFKFKFVNKIT